MSADKETPNDVATVRALREAERAAFVAGAKWQSCHYGAAEAEVERLYPMPTVERPRVVSGGGFEYRVIAGVLQFRNANQEGGWMVDPEILERTHAINTVLANPTEQVPADQGDAR
jgi:hypothetical protein